MSVYDLVKLISGIAFDFGDSLGHCDLQDALGLLVPLHESGVFPGKVWRTRRKRDVRSRSEGRVQIYTQRCEKESKMFTYYRLSRCRTETVHLLALPVLALGPGRLARSRALEQGLLLEDPGQQPPDEVRGCLGSSQRGVVNLLLAINSVAQVHHLPVHEKTHEAFKKKFKSDYSRKMEGFFTSSPGQSLPKSCLAWLSESEDVGEEGTNCFWTVC